MVAQPASVPAARRFVIDALSDWGHEKVAEDVELCVSELATNATLHSGSTFFHIELEERAGGVRATVADTGMGAVDELARKPDLTETFVEGLVPDDPAATGRGMFLVSALASTWGIDELPEGKRVWAEFGPELPGTDVADPTGAEVTWSAERAPVTLDPEEWAVVRFRGCPAALLIAHDNNLDEYSRELHLISGRMTEPTFQRLGAVLSQYVAEHATNWDPAGIIAREAVREGRELIDFDVLADRNIRESIEFLRNLIWEAEALSQDAKLITLPAPEPVQLLRDWMEGEFLAQIEDGAEPLSYPQWLAGARQEVRLTGHPPV
jgi:anti-sigma regulatory factor (Ser/Thr protein kinase)